MRCVKHILKHLFNTFFLPQWSSQTKPVSLGCAICSIFTLKVLFILSKVILTNKIKLSPFIWLFSFRTGALMRSQRSTVRSMAPPFECVWTSDAATSSRLQELCNQACLNIQHTQKRTSCFYGSCAHFLLNPANLVLEHPICAHKSVFALISDLYWISIKQEPL